MKDLKPPPSLPSASFEAQQEADNIATPVQGQRPALITVQSQPTKGLKRSPEHASAASLDSKRLRKPRAAFGNTPSKGSHLNPETPWNHQLYSAIEIISDSESSLSSPPSSLGPGPSPSPTPVGATRASRKGRKDPGKRSASDSGVLACKRIHRAPLASGEEPSRGSGAATIRKRPGHGLLENICARSG